MFTPRKCPVCGTIHNVEYTHSLQSMFRCDQCDTDFPLIMMPASPSAPDNDKIIDNDDIKVMRNLLEHPGAFWNNLNHEEAQNKDKQ